MYIVGLRSASLVGPRAQQCKRKRVAAARNDTGHNERSRSGREMASLSILMGIFFPIFTSSSFGWFTANASQPSPAIVGRKNRPKSQKSKQEGSGAKAEAAAC